MSAAVRSACNSALYDVAPLLGITIIVTTDVGGIPYLLTDKQDALICPIGDSRALSEALGLLVENVDLRRELTQNASKTMHSVFDRSDPNQIATLLQKMI